MPSCHIVHFWHSLQQRRPGRFALIWHGRQSCFDVQACDVGFAGALPEQKAEHEKEKKSTINTDKVKLQQQEAKDRYPQ